MRDPKRINTILEKIKIVWESNPDLRLCQLLAIQSHKVHGLTNADLFYFEDDKLESTLDDTIKDLK